MEREIDEGMIIGMLHTEEGAYLISYKQLKDRGEQGFYTLKEYLDSRCGTDLTHFNYDPYTGKKIDWTELRRINKEV